MRRKVVLLSLCFAGLLIFLAIGYAPFERSFVRSSLTSYVETFFKRSLRAESILQENDTLVFHNAVLTGSEDYRLVIPELRVTYSFSFWRQRLDATIELNAPQLTIFDSKTHVAYARAPFEFSWWQPHFNIKVNEGEILWGENQTSSAMITADLSAGDRILVGGISIAIQGKGSRSIQITLAENGFDAAAVVRINAAPSELVNALAVLFGVSRSNMEVTQGNLTGVLTLTSPGQDPGAWHPNGNLIVQDVLLTSLSKYPQIRLKEARLLFDPSEERDGDTIQAQGSLQVNAENAQFSLDAFKGHFNLNLDGNLAFSCRGQWWHEGRVKALRLDGMGNGFNVDNASLVFVGMSGSEGRVDFSSTASKELIAKISNLDAAETTFLKCLLAQKCEPLNSWRAVAGTLDGTVVISHQSARLTDLVANNLELRHQPRGCAISVRSCNGAVTLGLDSDRASQIEGALSLSGAALAFVNEKGSCNIVADTEGNLSFDSEGLVAVDLNGALANRGSWSLKHHNNWQVHIVTTGQELAQLLPGNTSDALGKVLGDQEYTIDASLIETSQGLSCQGEFQSPDDRLTFSCRWISPSLSRILEVNTPNEILSSFGTLRDGRVDGRGLSLVRYATPLWPEGFSKGLSGSADVRGTFDSNRAIIDIAIVNGRLDHPLFLLEASASTKSLHPAYNPTHDYFTLRIPISNAILYDKVHDLTFTDIAATTFVAGHQLVVKGVEATSDGLVFSAEGVIDGPLKVTGPEEYRLQVREITGTLTQLKQFISHLDDEQGFLHGIPLEGMVALNGKGGHLKYRPREALLEASVTGEVRDGSLIHKAGEVAVNELTMQFAYQYPGNNLAVRDLQGTVLVGRPGKPVEEYRLAGDRILIHQYPGKIIEFDLWIGDKIRDVVRIAGEAVTESVNEHLDTQVNFDLKNTHFGNVHPQTWHLGLRDWSQVTTFGLNLEFDLRTVLRDLQRLSRTGLTGLSKRFVEEVQSMPSASGDFRLNVAYDKAIPSFTYKVIGKEIALYDKIYHDAYLSGSVQGDTWLIDHFKLDDLSIAADVQTRGDIWKVNFLGIRAAQALTMGLEGDFNVDAETFTGRVNLFEANLPRLKDWPVTQRFGELYRPKGEVRAQGHLTATLKPSPEWLHVQGEFDTFFRSFELNGVRFRDSQRVTTQFDSDRGITLSSLRTGILPARLGDKPIEVRIDTVGYHLAQNELSIEGGRFQTGPGSLGWIAEVFKTKWGSIAYQLTRDLVDKVSTKEGIGGRFSLQAGGGASAINLALDSGTYYYQQHPYALKDFVVSLNPYELKLTGQFDYRGHPLWVTLRNECPLSPFGQLFLSDKPQDIARDHSLAVHWEYDGRQGFGIQKIEGSLYGIETDLHAQKHMVATHPTLAGKVWIDAEQTAPLLSPDIAESVKQYGLKARFVLDGKWQISSLLPEWVTFDGEARADQLQLSGYMVDNFITSLELSPKQMKFRNMIIEDPAGTFQASEVQLVRAAGRQWTISAPEIKATDFNPSALRHSQVIVKKRRHELVFPTMTLNNLSGEIADPSTLSGEGSARFSHVSKKRNIRGLVGLTSELMSNMGLDIEMVTPASGILEYQISDSKITLTRLKDTYSQGKLAKFSLIKDAMPATIDFDGNLDVAIRLKPNQPLLKLADKMTFYIQGTLKKPICTLE